MNYFSLFILVMMLGCLHPLNAQKTYKQLMQDYQVNFYDACKSAEKYFESRDKGKGSGWKGYQRWRAWNESCFYPSGDRSNSDPRFAQRAFERFVKNNPLTSSFSNGWNDLGPYDANLITAHYSPGIGRVEAFFINPSNTQQLYLGSRSGGFWRSFDQGNSWQNTTDFLIASGVNTIACPSNHPDTILINVRNASNGTTQGIYQSFDAGNNWTLSNFNANSLGWGGLGDNSKIHKIAYHPSIHNLVFVATSNGLYRSTDGLQSWTALLSGADIVDIAFHPTDPSVVYLYDTYYWGTNQSVVLRSNDGGFNFSSSSILAGNNDANGILSTTPSCPNCVYFASTNGIWRSDDAAVSFSFLSNPNESCDGFAVSDIDSLHLIYGYLDTHASEDGGYTFNQVTDWANSTPDSSYIHADLRTAQCINGVFYVGTDGYLAKSIDNGISWERLNDGTGIREFYAVGLSQSNYKVQMAGSQDNGTSILADTGWIEWNGGDGMESVVQPLNDQWMIGSWQYGTRNRTQDGGLSRQGIGSPNGGNGDWIAPLYLDPNDQMKVLHFSDKLYSSDEFGDNWDTLGGAGLGGNIKIAAVAENNSNCIIIARNANIKLSEDGGLTFNSIAAGLPGYSITDVAFDPNQDSTIVVTYNRYQNDNQKVYLSHDLGQSWTNISYNLTDMPVRTVVIDHTADATLYLGAEIGVFCKPMNGTTWTLYNPGLPNVTVRDLDIQYGTNTLRAATWGRGLWEYSLVGRNNFPSILRTQITDTPTRDEPKYGNPQELTALISYANNLSSVYLKWSINTPSLDSTIYLSNQIDSTWTSDQALPIYPVGTKMFFKVFAVGSNNDTTETYRFMYTVRVKEYCASSGNMNYTTAVTEVDLEDINRQSGKTQVYQDYTTTDSTYLTISNSYNASVRLDTDGAYTIYSKIWIDWNQDFDFDDLDESYDLGSANNATNGLTTLSPLNFTVPSHAVPGKTRMRVSCQYQQSPTACMNNADGEVEDYSLIVLANGLSTIKMEGLAPITVYPNPSKGTFQLDMGIAYDAFGLEITDASGKKVKQYNIVQQQYATIDIDGSSGVYFVRITVNDWSKTIKLIKD